MGRLKLPPAAELGHEDAFPALLEAGLGYASVPMMRKALDGDTSSLPVCEEARRYRPRAHYARRGMYSDESIAQLCVAGLEAKATKAVLREALSREPAARDSGRLEGRGVEAIAACLRRTWPPAHELDDRALRRVTRAARLQEAFDGERLMEAGLFRVLLDGAVRPPHASGAAVETGAVVATERAEFLALHSNEVAEVLAAHAAAERRRAFEVLKHTPLFRKWSRSKIDWVCNLLHFLSCKRGDGVVRQGEISPNVYFVLDGACRMTRSAVARGANSWPTRRSKRHPVVWETKRRARRSSRVVGRLRVGDAYGDTRLLSDAPCGETVVCTEPSTLAALDKAAFRAVLERGRRAAAAAQRDPRVSTKGHPSVDEILAVVAAVDDPASAGPPRPASRALVHEDASAPRWRSEADDASVASWSTDIDLKLRKARGRAARLEVSLGDDCSIATAQRGRDALRRARASQADLLRAEQRRFIKRGDADAARRIQVMLDATDVASVAGPVVDDDEGSYGTYLSADELSCVTVGTFGSVATHGSAAPAPRRPRHPHGVPSRRRLQSLSLGGVRRLRRRPTDLRPLGAFVDAVAANAGAAALARRRARRRRNLTYEKRVDDAIAPDPDHDAVI